MNGQGRLLCTLGTYILFLTLKLIATWYGLSNFNLEPKHTLASVLSFGMMFILTSYLVVATLKLNRKIIRHRVNSCIQTRRRVFQLQKGKTRSSYLLHALENSIKGRAHCGKEAHQRNKVLSRVSCSNLLKVGTYAFILSMACTDVQIVDDLQLYDTDTQYMSHLRQETAVWKR